MQPAVLIAAIISFSIGVGLIACGLIFAPWMTGPVLIYVGWSLNDAVFRYLATNRNVAK